MHFNLIVVSGALTVSAECDPLRGDTDARLLLTVRSAGPSARVDLLPVSALVAQLPDRLAAGDRLWVVGSLQRRFNATTGRSRLEIVAHQVRRSPVG